MKSNKFLCRVWQAVAAAEAIVAAAAVVVARKNIFTFMHRNPFCDGATFLVSI